MSQLSTTKKMIVFSFSILCGTSYVLLLRYSRGVLNETYNPQNIVFIAECFKFCICILMVSFGVVDSSLSETQYSQIVKITHLIRRSGFTWVPAICYFAQNCLDYKACEYLPACVYATLLQLKILSKALLSVWILNKTLKYQHWRALIILVVGSLLMEYHFYSVHNFSNSNDPIKGTVFVLIIVILSGLAGCFNELLLKNQRFAVGDMSHTSDTTTEAISEPELPELTLFDRNIQISFWSVLCGLSSSVISRMTGIDDNGLFDGFSYVAIILITLLTCIGLSISIITKYTDVIINSFISVISTIFISFGSHLFFYDDLDVIFVIGVVVTLFAASEYKKACQEKDIIIDTDKGSLIPFIEIDTMDMNL